MAILNNNTRPKVVSIPGWILGILSRKVYRRRSIFKVQKVYFIDPKKYNLTNITTNYDVHQSDEVMGKSKS